MSVCGLVGVLMRDWGVIGTGCDGSGGCEGIAAGLQSCSDSIGEASGLVGMGTGGCDGTDLGAGGCGGRFWGCAGKSGSESFGWVALIFSMFAATVVLSDVGSTVSKQYCVMPSVSRELVVEFCRRTRLFLYWGREMESGGTRWA